MHVLRIAVSWRGRRLAVHEALRTYARSAFGLFVLVAVTGTLSALVLVPTASDWTSTSYGQALLTKLALFTAVVVAALAGRRRLRNSRLPSPDGEPTRPAVGRPARVEAGLLAALLVVTAALTSATPARLVPASAVLAAPVGQVLRTADRVGQVTVSVVASRGRVEVRADTPDDGRPVELALTARLTAPTGATRRLELASCGVACWTALADWTDGVNRLTVDVDAGRWEAGAVDLPAPWPLTPAPALLTSVQQSMGSRGAVDTVETVTSGFGAPAPTTSRRTGQEYLESQPWSSGGATDAIVLPDGKERTLLFALPALGYHFVMRLDEHDRVVAERIVTPNHLLVRRYSFPEE